MRTAKISSKGQVAIPVVRPVLQFKAVTPKQGYGCIAHQGRPASEARIRKAARVAAMTKWQKRSEQG